MAPVPPPPKIKGVYNYEDTPEQATPEKLRQRRALADLMFKNASDPIGHAWGIPAAIAQMLGGRQIADRAGWLEREARKITGNNLLLKNPYGDDAETEGPRTSGIARGPIPDSPPNVPSPPTQPGEWPPHPLSNRVASLDPTGPTASPGPEQTRGVIKGNLSDEPVVSMTAENIPAGAPIRTAANGQNVPIGTIAPIAANSPQATAAALAARGGGGAQPPVMGPASILPVGAPPDAVVPRRPQISEKQMRAILSDPFIDPELAQRYLQMYTMQNQPMQMGGPGGSNWSVWRDPKTGKVERWWVPNTQTRKGPGGIEESIFVRPDGSIQYPMEYGPDGKPIMPDQGRPSKDKPPPALDQIENQYR